MMTAGRSCGGMRKPSSRVLPRRWADYQELLAEPARAIARVVRTMSAARARVEERKERNMVISPAASYRGADPWHSTTVFDGPWLAHPSLPRYVVGACRAPSVKPPTFQI